MFSPVAAISLLGFQRFTLFTSLPPEIRFIIWRLSLAPRVVEIIASNNRTGFYSQATLPAALHVCRESRQAVEALYPRCFGSFLLPERVRFNFDLDILYIDISQEEESLYRLFGVLKEAELARLKYVAIDEGYLEDGFSFLHHTIAGLNRAFKAMTDLQEMIVVRDITINISNDYPVPVQMQFYAEHKLGEAEEGWPIGVEELPDVKEYAGWKLSETTKMTAVYGWRAV